MRLTYNLSTGPFYDILSYYKDVRCVNQVEFKFFTFMSVI